MKKEKLSLIIDNNPVSFQELAIDYTHDMFQDYESNALSQLDRLTQSERTLLILYAELNSLKKIAKIYNCSKATIWNQIAKIRQKLKEHITYD